MQSDTKYARSGDLFIGYQVVGGGPFDLVFAPGYASHLEINWEWPPNARMLNRLASFSRLILIRPTRHRSLGSCGRPGHVRRADGRPSSRDGRRRVRTRSSLGMG